ncbi:unnamed protein product [Bursaphelenchus okinawaensis]|uniref:Protein kinase domain-containing protein n=1 Tax=Bursaphelenchus okinawaensis TaxID=465554 RepID=A0A811KYD7_9BILA|nr:unnamed protein product [Bursaphelenchus okinawaensis]CAG9113731.1 unnamed protein product [Bursaphelenchus okinawaensis]
MSQALDPKTKEPVAPVAKLPSLIQGERFKIAKGTYRVERKIKDIENCRFYLVACIDDKERDKKFEVKVQFKDNPSGYWRKFKNEVPILEKAKKYEDQLPNLVHMFDHGEIGDIEVIVLPFFPHDLDKMYKFMGKFSQEEAYKISCQCADGLKQLHSMEVFHGSVRLSSYVMTSNEIVKLTDFGHTYNNQTDDEAPKVLTDAFIKPNEYSARGAHMNWLGSYKDDLESLGYCIVALFYRRGLEWRRAGRSKLMLKMKKKFMSEPAEHLDSEKYPSSMHKIFLQAEAMKRTDKIDYSLLTRTLTTCAEEMKLAQDAKDQMYGFINRRQPSKEYVGSRSRDSNEVSSDDENKKQIKGGTLRKRSRTPDCVKPVEGQGNRSSQDEVPKKT